MCREKIIARFTQNLIAEDLGLPNHHLFSLSPREDIPCVAEIHSKSQSQVEVG